MTFKFEKLDVWQRALDYIDVVYEIAEALPKSEDHNIKKQILRAATSVALNIAEGSTGQTDVEQARFLGMAIRSLLETIACQHIISRRKFLQDSTLLRKAYSDAMNLARMLQDMRSAIVPQHSWVREEAESYTHSLTSIFEE